MSNVESIVERRKLSRTLHRLHKQGLVHIGFTWGPGAKDCTPEELAGEINNLHASIERGETEPLDFVDRHLPQTDIRELLAPTPNPDERE